MEYKYEALDAQGNEVEDTIKAYDKRAAIDAIRKKGLFPTIVRVIGTGVESKTKSRTLPDWLICRTTKEKAMFSIICLLLILIAGLLSGCKRVEPTRHPTFENFDMVKVKLSGNIGQIANNRYEFDWDKNCWKVQVKMKRESRLGDMVEKLMPEGLPTKIFYERELEKYEQKAEIKTD